MGGTRQCQCRSAPKPLIHLGTIMTAPRWAANAFETASYVCLSLWPTDRTPVFAVCGVIELRRCLLQHHLAPMGPGSNAQEGAKCNAAEIAEHRNAQA